MKNSPKKESHGQVFKNNRRDLSACPGQICKRKILMVTYRHSYSSLLHTAIRLDNHLMGGEGCGTYHVSRVYLLIHDGGELKQFVRWHYITPKLATGRGLPLQLPCYWSPLSSLDQRSLKANVTLTE